MSEGYADLHLHTTASDGTQGISQLVKRARAYGLSTIAITDHDTISKELTERVIKINGLEVITGVELKVDFDGIRGELLGYFVDPACPSMHEMFLFMKRSREERMAKMVKRCRDKLGLDIKIDEVRAIASGSIGRPHLAQLLLERGAVPTLKGSFDRLLAQGKPCYIPLKRPGFRDAARAVHAAGGVTSIPHPCFMEVENWEEFLIAVRQEGVDGVEVFYPYRNAADKLKASPKMLASLAKKHGFLLTGGSDDHGPSSVKEALGEVRVPYCYVKAIKRACGLH
jgi:hypothetical protein